MHNYKYKKNNIYYFKITTTDDSLSTQLSVDVFLNTDAFILSAMQQYHILGLSYGICIDGKMIAAKGNASYS